jgi:hypothetical protein
MLHAAAADDHQNAEECFLPHLLAELGRTHPALQLDIEDRPKVSREVTLRLILAVPEPADIVCVEAGKWRLGGL